MKVVVLLLSCFALSVAQEDVFELNGGTMRASIMDWMTNMTKEDYLSEDGTSFKPEITGLLVLVEPQICPVESNKCSPDDNWLFGCRCMKGFRALGECQKQPCQLFRHFRDNGPDCLNRFFNAESYEDRYRILVNYIVDPISRALCQCPGMIGASIKCVRRYDGALFQLLERDRTGFDNVVNSLDWNAVKTVLLGYVKAGCGERNGKDCVTEISKIYTLLGTIIDNTLNGEDVCLSLIRIEEEFEKFREELEKTIASFDIMETKSIKSAVNRFVDAYIDMEREALCEPGCAAEISDTLYTCCAKHAMEVLSSKPMKKGYQKLLTNVWSLFSEDAAPKLSNAINKYLSVYDLESFCGDQTDVYREKNQQCDALEV